MRWNKVFYLEVEVNVLKRGEKGRVCFGAFKVGNR